jgi:hypothetical protein
MEGLQRPFGFDIAQGGEAKLDKAQTRREQESDHI